eukprot:TRINITY_DN67860_c3_g1_i2.p1 TRINITY_DN67860_c3_g1~~TRINITY_DN67860_c3_g1_i2.p1  ORF type:complete len:265 (-),score=36.60 TRINITY_DN67860_c3_g1_i2:175-969(-)
MFLRAFLLFICVSLVLGKKGKGAPPPPRGEPQELSFEPPKLSEEDQHGTTMPTAYKCDGCKVAAWFIATAFLKEEQRLKLAPEKKLKESQVLEALEGACKGKNFENHGIKGGMGAPNMLSGPGLNAEGAGVMMGGGKWPGRLADQCRTLIGDVGDEELYDLWHANSAFSFSSQLCTKETTYCKSMEDYMEHAWEPDELNEKLAVSKPRIALHKAKDKKFYSQDKAKIAEAAKAKEKAEKKQAEKKAKKNKGKKKKKSTDVKDEL